jgi:hypothetical protein
MCIYYRERERQRQRQNMFAIMGLFEGTKGRSERKRE